MYGVRSPYKRLLGVQLTFKEFADGLLFVNFKHDLVMSWLQLPAVVTRTVDSIHFYMNEQLIVTTAPDLSLAENDPKTPLKYRPLTNLTWPSRATPILFQIHDKKGS